MRLLRPHVPMIVRCRVALRQLGWGERSKDGQAAAIEDLLRMHRADPAARDECGYGYARLLLRVLAELAPKLGCEPKDLHLDHNPALENRPFNKRTKKYTPDANDPDYLIYREKHAHRIKTLVRGDGAQHSDAAVARIRKRRDHKAKRKRRHRWPPSRKLQSRKFSRRTKRTPTVSSEVKRLRRRIAVLETALEPFALEAAEWWHTVSNGYHPGVTEPRQRESYSKAVFTIGNCRRAAKLLGIPTITPAG